MRIVKNDANTYVSRQIQYAIRKFYVTENFFRNWSFILKKNIRQKAYCVLDHVKKPHRIVVSVQYGRRLQIVSLIQGEAHKQRVNGKMKFLWEKEFEYNANVKKLHKWAKDHGYNKRSIGNAIGSGKNKSYFIYAKGNFTLYEAKKLAVGVGMSLYDFIDIFLSDIYPVTPGDFDLLSDD